MVNSIQKTHQVVRGDCPWNVAKNYLKSTNQSVTNADIAREMQRLAKLNNCESVDDFSAKYFSSTGKNIILSSGDPEPTKHKQPDITPIKSRPIKFDDAEDGLQRSKNTSKNELPEAVKPFVRLAFGAGVVSLVFDSILSKQKFIKKINDMNSDKDRIIQYNKTEYQGEYYGIVDKKKCQLEIYDKQGNVVSSYPIGVGKTKGDNLGAYYLERAERTRDAWMAEQNRYTTAGQFTLDEVLSDLPQYVGNGGQVKVMYMKGDSKGVRAGDLAIHMVPQGKEYTASREYAIKSSTKSDNRLSYGCINLLEADYDKMHAYLGEGHNIYVLPEEKGNKLQLVKQSDGSYKFEQLYHKNDERSVSKDLASQVLYDVHPERSSRYSKMLAYLEQLGINMDKV